MGERIYKGCERIYEGVEFNNLKEIIQNTEKNYGDRPAFKFKDGKTSEITTMSYKEYVGKINALGTALIDMGFKGRRIGVISENRYEWEVSYLAIVSGVGVVVPLDKSLPENEILSLIERSEMEAIIYSSKYDDAMAIAQDNELGNVKCFINMDIEDSQDDVLSFNKIIEKGNSLLEKGNRSYLDAEIDNTQMSIMLFTSGTTSKSKAVMLSHRNICNNIYDISSVFDVTTNDTFLSFLPLHHVFECTVGFLYPFSVGASIGFCQGIRHIAENVKDFEVSCMISVPILYDNIYKKIMQGIEKQGKKDIVKFGSTIAKGLGVIGLDVRRRVFKDVIKNLGGHVRLFVAGGAAFGKDTEKGFNEFGIECYQGYGLTETAPVIAAEHKGCAREGSIGKPLPSVQVKILDPDELGIGELAAKGPSVMIGYYGNADNPFTSDGWFKTGDLAYIDKDGYIFITGRQKSVIVLKNGKNVFPEEVETLLNEIPGIKESFVYGKPENDDQSDLKICAELVYDLDKVKSIYGVENPEEIKDKLWEKVKEVNKSMPTYKYVKEIIVTTEELIKTTTLKIKRFEEIKKVIK